MTIKELKQIIKDLPDDAPVVIQTANWEGEAMGAGIYPAVVEYFPLPDVGLEFRCWE